MQSCITEKENYSSKLLNNLTNSTQLSGLGSSSPDSVPEPVDNTLASTLQLKLLDTHFIPKPMLVNFLSLLNEVDHSRFINTREFSFKDLAPMVLEADSVQEMQQPGDQKDLRSPSRMQVIRAAFQESGRFPCLRLKGYFTCSKFGSFLLSLSTIVRDPTASWKIICFTQIR